MKPTLLLAAFLAVFFVVAELLYPAKGAAFWLWLAVWGGFFSPPFALMMWLMVRQDAE